MSLKVVEKSIDELKMYENNPRRNDEAVDEVAKSIEEFGFKIPMVIDKDNVIVCGHTRYKACLRLGIKTVPCVIADDLSDDQIKAFRLVENKTSELADWDYSLLDFELDGITLDMSEFGFADVIQGLNVNDEDFISDTEITKSKERKIICPHCGKEIEI